MSYALIVAFLLAFLGGLLAAQPLEEVLCMLSLFVYPCQDLTLATP